MLPHSVISPSPPLPPPLSPTSPSLSLSTPPQLTLTQRIDHHKSLLRTEMQTSISRLKDELHKTKDTLKASRATLREQAHVIADLTAKYEYLKPFPDKLALVEKELASVAGSLEDTRGKLEHWTAVAKQREIEIQVRGGLDHFSPSTAALSSPYLWSLPPIPHFSSCIPPHSPHPIHLLTPAPLYLFPTHRSPGPEQGAQVHQDRPAGDAHAAQGREGALAPPHGGRQGAAIQNTEVRGEG